MLLEAIAAMRNQEVMQSDRRQSHISLHHRRVTEEAISSPELDRSKYGDQYADYRDQVLFAIQSENVRADQDAQGGHWEVLESEGRELAGEWGCESV